jgi:LCP family protein required for cell wall assembly
VSTAAPTPGRPRWVRAATAIGITFALIFGMVAAGGYLVYRHLDSNITVDTSADDELGRPSLSGGPSATPASDLSPLNILVMGSDTRVGQGGEGGSAKVYSTAQSDVVMLVHLYQGRKRAIVMSIPRDTWVTLPMCRTKGGGQKGGYQAKFNEAFTIGGPACTIKLVKQVTGLPIDHFVVVDFNGVKDIINAVGGVHICLKKALHDPIGNGEGSGLDLKAGAQVVMGDQGLALLRARHHIGDGSDIGRMTRQHAFLSAMVRQVESTSLLTNPIRLYEMLDAATRSITTDPGLGSLLKLKGLAQTLTGLKPANVTFLTIPWKDRGDGANVLVNTGQAQPILAAIAADKPWPPVASASSTPVTTVDGRPLKTPPTQVHVKVLNASGVSGAAAKAAADLTALGFKVVGVGTAPAVSTATTVRYDPAYDESGRTLTAAVTGATSKSDTSLASTLVLTIGTSYSGVHAVTVAPSTGNSDLPQTAVVQTAAEDGCF